MKTRKPARNLYFIISFILLLLAIVIFFRVWISTNDYSSSQLYEGRAYDGYYLGNRVSFETDSSTEIFRLLPEASLLISNFMEDVNSLISTDNNAIPTGASNVVAYEDNFYSYSKGNTIYLYKDDVVISKEEFPDDIQNYYYNLETNLVVYSQGNITERFKDGDYLIFNNVSIDEFLGNSRTQVYWRKGEDCKVGEKPSRKVEGIECKDTPAYAKSLQIKQLKSDSTYFNSFASWIGGNSISIDFFSGGSIQLTDNSLSLDNLFPISDNIIYYATYSNTGNNLFMITDNLLIDNQLCLQCQITVKGVMKI